jgi:large subunit ribosomal protein L25
MDVTLIAETGRTTGSRPSTRLRAEDKVPAVVYGLDREPVSVVVDRKELRRALNTEAGINALITLDVDGHEDLTIVKDLQRHGVRRSIEHVDFLRVDRNQTITVEVPIVLIGEAKEVDNAQGVVEQLLHGLTVSARPGSIPAQFEADITDLVIGGAVRVGDLTLPAGVTTEVDADEQIALGSGTRAEAEPTEAEAEAGEGDEGEAAEGGASGADDSGE